MDNVLNHETMFQEYPDMVDVETMCKMLDLKSIKSGYKLLKNNEIQHFRIGTLYRIPKVFIVQYILRKSHTVA